MLEKIKNAKIKVLSVLGVIAGSFALASGASAQVVADTDVQAAATSVAETLKVNVTENYYYSDTDQIKFEI